METRVFCDARHCREEADVALCSGHYDAAIEEAKKSGYDEGYAEAKEEAV